MKRVFAGTCLAAFFAVGLSAQTGQTQPPTAQSQSDKSVTVTGCLQAGEEPNSFVLSNVKFDDKSATGATGTSGTASASEKIKLTGSPTGTKLSEHVGQTVQVTGTLSPASSRSPSGTAGTAGQTKSKDEPSQSLNVRSVKMVSSSCNPM